MQKLKRLTLSLTFVSVISVSAFAGETEIPPCVPGETLSPPCVAQPLNDDSAPPGEIQSPPASNTAVDVTDITEAVLWALSLF